MKKLESHIGGQQAFVVCNEMSSGSSY